MSVLFGLIIILVGIATALLPWITFFRMRSLENEVAQLRAQINLSPSQQQPAKLQATSAPHSLPSSTEQILSSQDESFDWDENDTVEENVRPTAPPAKPSTSVPVTAKPRIAEWNIGTKLPVWIGAVSLAFAAFFMVKYGIEAGFLGPTTRTILGLLFGVVLIGAGNALHKFPKIANGPRVAQGLVGAGIVALYFTLYGAFNLYHIIAPMTGFAGMAAVTVAAILMSLRHGQPIAVFGMVGGLLTPLLIHSQEPNFAGLFAYLFMMYVGLQTLLARQGWWKLSFGLLGGMYLWALLCFSTSGFAEHTSALVLFILGITGYSFFLSRKALQEGEDTKSSATMAPQHLINYMAVSGATLALFILQNRFIMSLFDWSVNGVISVAILALAYLRPTIYREAVYAKLGADLLLFLLAMAHTSHIGDIDGVAIGLGVVYIALPALILREKPQDVTLPVVQIIAALSLYLIEYKWGDISPAWRDAGFFGGAALVCAVAAAYMSARMQQFHHPRSAGLYALGVTAFLAIGLAIELPFIYLPMAIAAQVAATYWVARRTGMESLPKIAMLMTGVFALLSAKPIIAFVSHIMRSLVDEVGAEFANYGSYHAIPGAYLLPSLFLAGAFALIRSSPTIPRIQYHALFGGALVLMLGALYICMRTVTDSVDNAFTPQAGFIGREAITILFAASGFGVLWVAARRNIAHVTRWGHALLLLAMARQVYFDVFLHNPLWDSSQSVGDLPLLNGVTLTYGSALALTLGAKHIKLFEQNVKLPPLLYKILAMVYLLLLTSLNVRQIFHGEILTHGEVTHTELYAYSVTWLLTGLGLLAYGIRKNDKTLRLSALGFLTLTIGKVFLIDASELEGLYRIFSFFGLGVSLIGLSVFYTRYMARNGQSNDPS